MFKQRHKVGKGLSRASLRFQHDIPMFDEGWYSVLLNGGQCLKALLGQNFFKLVIEWKVLKITSSENFCFFDFGGRSILRSLNDCFFFINFFGVEFGMFTCSSLLCWFLIHEFISLPAECGDGGITRWSPIWLSFLLRHFVLVATVFLIFLRCGCCTACNIEVCQHL